MHRGRSAWRFGSTRASCAARWQLALERALRRMGKSAADCRADRKFAPWKVVVAAHLKQSTHASNRWLTEHLQMGTPVAVSQCVSVCLITAARISLLSSSSLKNLKPHPLGLFRPWSTIGNCCAARPVVRPAAGKAVSYCW